MLKSSVALCTYNGARFLHDQLQSIFEQTVLPHEIVLFDDVSSDATLQIAEGMLPEATRLGIDFVIRRNQNNLGYIKNFEQVAEACSGDVIFLCDQDDLWMPAKIATLLPLFEADPALMLAYSDARLVDAQGRSIDCTQSEALGVSQEERRMLENGLGFDALLVRNLVTGATAAFRRELLNAAKPFSTVWIHDEWLAIVAAAVGSIAFCPLELIDYRQHESNQIGLRRRELNEKIGSMFRSRGNFYRLQVERTEDLRRRLATLGDQVDAKKIGRLEDRLNHIRFRASLPVSRLARVGPAILEWRSGRYRRHSNGLRALLRDLLETV